MLYLECLVIVLAILLEWETLVKARDMHAEKNHARKADILIRGYPRAMKYFFAVGAIGYLAFTLYWMFSTVLPIQIAAITMVAISLASAVWSDKKPIWFIRIDSILCIMCLLTVGYYKFPALL